MEKESNKQLNRIDFILCIFFFLSALFLRIWGITYESFWFDEIWTAVTWANSSLLTTWKSLWSEIEGNLPLYPLFISIWGALFGQAEIVLRWPSAIAGALAFPFLYMFLIRIYERQVALIALATQYSLLALISVSQEARGYSILYLLVCLNICSWLLFEKHKKLWIISSIILSWTHYYGLIYLASLFIQSVFSQKNRLKYFLFILIFILPLAGLIFFQFNHGPDLSGDYISPFDILSWYSGINNNFLNFLILSLIGLSYFRNKYFKPLFFVMVFPYLCYLFLKIFGKEIGEERYFIVCLPSLIILTSHGLNYLFERYRLNSTLFYGLIVIVCSTIPFINLYYTTPRNADFRGAANFILTHRENCSNTLLVMHPKIWQYYVNRTPSINVKSFSSEINRVNKDFWFAEAGFLDDTKHNTSNLVKKYNLKMKYSGFESAAYCFSLKEN